MNESITIRLGREQRENTDEPELLSCEDDRESVENLFLSETLVSNKGEKYDMFVANSLITYGMFNVLVDHMNKFPAEFHVNIMKNLQEDEKGKVFLEKKGML